MTVMKLLIEANGDIYEEEYTTKKTAINIKTCIDQIIEIRTPTREEYITLTQKNRSEITEIELLAMEKYQLVRKQNFLNDAPEEIVNKWIKIYSKNEIVINNILALRDKNDNEEQINDVGKKTCKKTKGSKKTEDALIIAKKNYTRSCYDKTIAALNCDGWYTNVIKFKAGRFTKAINNIAYTKAETQSLGLKGSGLEKMRIARAVLSKHGIRVTTHSDRISKDNERTSVVIAYSLRRDADLYNVVHNLVALEINNDQIDQRFLEIIKRYNKCKKYRIYSKTGPTKSMLR
jgi:hypothetical protein